jgi:hypothetical protein
MGSYLTLKIVRVSIISSEKVRVEMLEEGKEESVAFTFPATAEIRVGQMVRLRLELL